MLPTRPPRPRRRPLPRTDRVRGAALPALASPPPHCRAAPRAASPGVLHYAATRKPTRRQGRQLARAPRTPGRRLASPTGPLPFGEAPGPGPTRPRDLRPPGPTRPRASARSSCCRRTPCIGGAAVRARRRRCRRSPCRCCAAVRARRGRFRCAWHASWGSFTRKTGGGAGPSVLLMV